jgi:hypothetical protein
MESAKELIEKIARLKGTFTASFRRQAEQDAEQGRGELLQVMQGAEENREDLSKALNMYYDNSLIYLLTHNR